MWCNRVSMGALGAFAEKYRDVNATGGLLPNGCNKGGGYEDDATER
jgi:hypothetical protein